MKKELKSKCFGWLAYGVMQLLKMTWRIHVIADPAYCKKQPYLFAFWHGKQLLPVLQLKKHLTPNVALVSPSQDGDILQVCLNCLGYEVERGSSRDGNIRSLVRLIKKLKSGCSVGFGIDGPIGPIYQVKPGMTYLSQKCQVAIVPLGSAASSSWILEKAWDKFQIPKPFAKVIYCIGKPFLINATDDLKASNQMLEQRIHEIESTATALLN